MAKQALGVDDRAIQIKNSGICLRFVTYVTSQNAMPGWLGDSPVLDGLATEPRIANAIKPFEGSPVSFTPLDSCLRRNDEVGCWLDGLWPVLPGHVLRGEGGIFQVTGFLPSQE